MRSPQSWHTSYGMSRSIAEAHSRACAAASGGLTQFIPLLLLLPDPSIRWLRLPNNILDHIVPNSLQPLILTPDQFTEWLTLYGIVKMDETSHLFPTHIIIRHRLTITNCVLPFTYNTYSSGLIQILQWFPQSGVGSHASFRTTDLHVCFHLGSWFHGQKYDEDLGQRSPTLAHH